MTRVLAMTGMALVAGATVGAGPASAAPAGTATTTHAAQGAQGADHWSPGHDRVVNYYRNPFSCNRAGRVGELRDSWDSHDCSRVRGGLRRGWWALTVSWDNHGHGHDQHGQNDQHGHDQHDQHGQDQHGQDDQHGHDQHGQDQHGQNDQHDQHGHDQHDGGHGH
jgi:hypothetical protein